LGYSGWRLEDVARLVEGLDALVVDVRLVPASRAQGFGAADLEGRLGSRYVWLRGFGNVNYQGDRPITLADFDGAAATLRQRLEGGPVNVLLLCACRDVATCHRKVVAERLAAAWGGVVAHLEPPAGGGGGRKKIWIL
jgi:uncharacterized protein (DUF488 family)